MNVLTAQKNQITGTNTIRQGIAERDKTAVKKCVDTYGNFIWALAKKFTRSREEAAKATEEIFIDIWRYCERGGLPIEEKMIKRIALRRLIKTFQYAEKKSMATIDAINEQGAGMDRISNYV